MNCDLPVKTRLESSGRAWPQPWDPGWRYCGPSATIRCGKDCEREILNCEKRPGRLRECCRIHETVHWRHVKPSFCKPKRICYFWWTCPDEGKKPDSSKDYLPGFGGDTEECYAYAPDLNCTAQYVNSPVYHEAYCARAAVNKYCGDWWGNGRPCVGVVPRPRICDSAPFDPPAYP